VRAWLAIVGLVAGCGGSASSPVEPEPWSPAWVARERDRYLTDGAFRRAQLERSLVNHQNLYSKQRLDAYGLGARGWDVLPVWNPRSRPVTAELASVLERGERPQVSKQLPPLWDGTTPATDAEWIALGRRVFFEYPMRSEVFMEWGLTKPELARAVGVERTRDGSIPGLVVFADIDGETRVGITCAICHTSVRDGELVVGRARRSFDYGRLRIAYFADTGEFVAPVLAQRMATWGPGRADVTEDNDEDPVAIPDLWGLRAMPALTQAGTINHTGPVALALRQETQLLHTNHQRVRPPRELAWALAMFLYSLEPPPQPAPPSTPELARGKELFTLHCKKCHANAAYGGEPIPADKIGTDPALANGTARGTGTYRVPALIRVADGAPYLHHGVVPSLDALLSPARLDGPDAIPGHLAGTQLAATDRAALIAFLGTL
jgi:mono/diheme cytochrome c family protein